MVKVNKPVGVIAHVDHDKVSLTALVTKVLCAKERFAEDSEALINQLKGDRPR